MGIGINTHIGMGNIVGKGALLNQIPPEVTAYVLGLTTPLSTTQVAKLSAFVRYIKTNLGISNLSQAFDYMRIWAGETQESSLRNIVKNAHHGTLINNPTWVQYEGITGSGAPSYAKSGYNPAIDKVALSLNSASIGIYVRTVGTTENKILMGCSDATNGLFYSPAGAAGGEEAYRCNTSSTVTGSVMSEYGGMYILSRTASNLTKSYRNKTAGLTSILASSAIPNLEMYSCCRNSSGAPVGASNNQIAFEFAGRGLSQSDVDVITHAIEGYMDGNGKGIIPPESLNSTTQLYYNTELNG